ncbi:FecR family protein [Terrimonas pollutisoli]|uniref:FecR family protein n=1 Tax=Terrimonas pollutisoli TaxID=3034147 RepID=UPI0023EBEC1F|nr:FecR family protein [Terrimonas sp. H1YJ31]
MKNYKLYTVSDFVLDEDFIQWVYTGRNDQSWNAWLMQNPDKALTVAEAKQIVQSLKLTPASVSENELDEEVHKLLNNIHAGQAVVRPIKSSKKWWWLAAAVVILAGLGIWSSSLINKKSAAEKFSYTEVIPRLQLIEQVNTSAKSIHILLPDSSTVELSPQSRLSYSNDFKDSANRDVYLLGEAFFSVTKDANKPFRVFANGIVTKVLGTSFTVRSFEKEQAIKVTVRTGKVRVYPQTEESEKTGGNAVYPDDILLTPNQEAIFEKEQKKFQKKILEKPVIIDPGISLHSMIYEETPVMKVLEEFKKAYGISIVYDEDSLRTCTITADLTDESLYSRLDLICKAIDANYEIINSEVFIRAKGCR